MSLTPDIASLKSCLDEWVLALPDPAAAMAAIVQVWALGGKAGDDLLDDLEAIAIRAALHRGIELTAPELLESIGQHQRARRIRDAVQAGRVRHQEVSARAQRLQELRLIREEHLV